MTIVTSQQLRENPRVIRLLDETTSGKDFDIASKAWHTPERVNTYLLDRLEGYEWSTHIDSGLFREFKQDFEGWTEELFDMADRNIRSTLRTYLKNQGVLVGTEDSRIRNSKQLFELLQKEKYENWPPEEITKYMKSESHGTFESYQNPYYGKSNIQISSPKQISNNQISSPSQISSPKENKGKEKAVPEPFASFRQTPPFPPTQQTPQYQQAPVLTQQAPQQATIKALTDLKKLYMDGELKFGGEMYDVLDTKLVIFDDLCMTAGVYPDIYDKAYSTMLKGAALEFFYDCLAKRGLTFDEMTKKTREFFHTEENMQMYESLWHTTTLKQVMGENPDRNLSENLDILIKKLQKIQRGLSIEDRAKTNMRNKLVNACRGVTACQSVVLKLSATFESVAADLRNAVDSHIACQKQVPWQYNNDADEQFWTDRQYRNNGNRGREGSGFQRENRFERNNRSNGYGDKKCFIYKKPGCWSTRHPPIERKPKQEGWRRYMQEEGEGSSKADFMAYLMGYEGIDVGE